MGSSCVWSDVASVPFSQRLEEYSSLVGLMRQFGLGIYDNWSYSDFDPYSDMYGCYYSFGQKDAETTWYDRIFVSRGGEWMELPSLSSLSVKQFFLRHLFPTEMLDKERFEAVVIYHHEKGSMGDRVASHHVFRVWLAVAEKSVA